LYRHTVFVVKTLSVFMENALRLWWKRTVFLVKTHCVFNGNALRF
jgi:hypothetical protein